MTPSVPVTSRLLATSGFLALAMLLGGCGSGGSSNGTSAQVTSVGKQVAEYMQRWYWWLDELPAADPASFSTGPDALAALRVPADRYSFSEPTASFNAFFVSGSTTGFGIGYEVEGAGPAAALKIRYTQPQSNAALALLRGDRIVSIDGETIGDLIAQDRLDDAFGPAEEGISRRFDIERMAAGAPVRQSIVLTKSRYQVAASFGARVLGAAETGLGRPVAYLHLFTFTSSSSTEWLNLLANLQAQGFQDLVVDLRDNGGGSVAAANQIASSLAASQAGQPSVGLRFNRLNTSSNQQLSFVPTTPALEPQRLVWLTSSRTCSAAEELIHALEPYRASASTARIGASTCGKPVGFTPQIFGDRTYSIVTFQSANRDGAATYFSGLPPTCAVADPGMAPYGSMADPLLNAALQWLGSGSCGAVQNTMTEKALGAPSAEPLAGVKQAQRFTDWLGLR